MRFSAIVHPNAKRDAIGGDYAGSLVIRVRAQAIDDKANTAAMELIANTFGVSKSSVRLVLGQTSRRKLFALADASPQHEALLKELLVQPMR